MPFQEQNQKVFEYKMPIGGVNMSVGRLGIQEEQALELKNLFVRGGIKKRDGYAKRVATAVQAGTNKITFLHRFYLQDGTSQLLAGGGTVYARQNGTVWTNIATGKTDDTAVNTETWGALNKVYFADGVLAGATWDGTTFVASITGLSGIVPTQFLAYQDRLLMISVTEPGVLRWSDSFDDTNWVSAAATGVQPDSVIHGMIIHSSSVSQEQGQNAQVLLAGSNGMYLFSGTNLSLTFSNYTIQSLATRVGCNAPKTMAWTPMGTVYLGTDLQVYLLPFDSIVPIPIGDNIRSQVKGFTGLESISAGDTELARAVYQDGFYKLSITLSPSTFNNVQWWLDVSESFRRTVSTSVANRALSVGWFGPMDGLNFSEMISMPGAGDKGEFIAGEGDTAVGAFVYNSTSSEEDDDGTSIAYQWRSFYNPLSNPNLNSNCHLMEIEFLNTNQTINFTFQDSNQKNALGSVLFSTTGSGSIYGTVNYGSANYGGESQSRQRLSVSPPISLRLVGVVMFGDSSVDLEVYAVRIEEMEQGAAFEANA